MSYFIKGDSEQLAGVGLFAIVVKSAEMVIGFGLGLKSELELAEELKLELELEQRLGWRETSGGAPPTFAFWVSTWPGNAKVELNGKRGVGREGGGSVHKCRHSYIVTHTDADTYFAPWHLAGAPHQRSSHQYHLARSSQRTIA